MDITKNILNSTHIGHYHIIKKLGQGGMSIVYEAFDNRLKRPVALKMLHPLLASNEECRKRFLREAEAVAKLSHPNIMAIFDVSAHNHEEVIYIASELLIGKTLKDFYALEFKKYPEIMAMIIFILTEALHHAHDKGIIHRDIKPENIMIGVDGQIKLMDFGIADIGKDNMTKTGVLVGSLAHISPEIIKGQRASFASDIYSLSTVFYWLITGELPFKEDSPHALLKAIVDNKPKKVQVLSSYISDNLALIIEKGLSKEPKDRYQHAEDMGQAILDALKYLGLHFSDKDLQLGLKDNGIHIHKFHEQILKQIKAKQKYYNNSFNHHASLVLKYRLEAISNNDKNKSNYLLPIFLFIVLGLMVIYFIKLTMFHDESLDHVIELASANEEDLPMSMLTHTSDLAKTSSIIEPALKNIHVVIWPFADVLLDGKLIAKHTKTIDFNLAKGVHKLEFRHDYAATIDKVVNVTDLSTPINLKINLTKSKPAFLVILSEHDADIAIDGHYKGTSSKSMHQPIIIPLPDKTHAVSKEIIISRLGFKPLIINAQLIAGQTKKIAVTLRPNND